MKNSNQFTNEENLLEEYQDKLGHNTLPQSVKNRIWDQAWENVAQREAAKTTVTQSRDRSRLENVFLSLKRLTWQMGMAMLLIVALLSSAGVALAARQSLPGDGLYPVKRSLERARAQLTPTRYTAELELIFLDRRVAELEQLLAADRSVPEGITEEIADSFDELQNNPSVQVSQEVQNHLAIHLGQLQELASMYPREQSVLQIYEAAAGAYTSLGGNLSSLSLPVTLMTSTPTPTLMPTATYTATPSPTPTLTFTPKPTFTPIPTFTPTPTLSPTNTPTQVVLPSPTVIPPNNPGEGSEDNGRPEHPEHPPHPPQDPNPPSPPGRDKDKG